MPNYCRAFIPGGTWFFTVNIWKNAIRDDDSYQCYVDYVHVNPVKHGVLARV